MLYLITLILLTIIFYIWLGKLLNRSFTAYKNNYKQLEDEYKKLSEQSAALKKENGGLKESVEKTIALYDITKDICKTLDEEKVFNIFCDHINRYIKVRDCRLIKDGVDLSHYKDYTILPLKIEKKPVGYLIASDISEPDRDKFYILAEQFLLGIKRALLYKKIQELAITDSLTQVFSRRHFLERVSEELERSKRFKLNFSYLMIDIDNFKDYNDNYGHLVGDAILKEISHTIKENIRQIDFMGRYGGEELSIILAETDKEQAPLAAERIRLAIESNRIRVYDEDLKVTISIGISAYPVDATNNQMLIDKADQALYKAKQAGRNRVYMYGK
jgi:diguanylate cyclase (GGDEF)-like protein